MSIVNITPLNNSNFNLSLNQDGSELITLSNISSNTAIVTVNQGLQGPPGPPGAENFDIVAGSGIIITEVDDVYTISSTFDTLAELSSLPTEGRLTIQSGNPINNSNDISGSVIYYTPYLGNKIALYDTIESKWKIHSFNEITFPLSGVVANTNYDIFIYDNVGNLSLELVSWLNNTSRNIGIAYKDGLLVQNSNFTKRYLGTIRGTGVNSTEDSINRRFIFNAYNSIEKVLSASDSVLHTYTSGAIRPYRNITTIGLTRCEFVQGLSNNIFIICKSFFTTENFTSHVAIGLDTTSSLNTRSINTTTISFGSPASILENSASDLLTVSEGYHYLQLLQSGSSVTSFNSASMRAAVLC